MDTTIAATERRDGTWVYDIGRPNWDVPRVPIVDRAGATRTLTSDQRIDVVILGDGFLEEREFRAQLRDWIATFAAIDVYDTFAGAFRIRALYEPSAERASTRRASAYRVAIRDDDEGVDRETSWWGDDGEDNEAFRDALFAALDAFSVNDRRYPDDLDVGQSNLRVGNNQAGLYRNLVVSVLVRTATTSSVSGAGRTVPRPGSSGARLRVAVGANTIHEFSHAFAMLSDEYISDRSGTPTRDNPTVPSVLTLSNLSQDDRAGRVPWEHLAPWGEFLRHGTARIPRPVVGWAWLGGVSGVGVWHAEYQCLMNGTHDNYAYTPVAGQDPTANADGSYSADSGANLRDRDRFCVWCHEIVTLRILEKTDQLWRPGDSDDVAEQGRQWHQRWADGLRGHYHALFDVAGRIRAQEAAYATVAPGPAGERLDTSPLYHPFVAADVEHFVRVAPVSAEEWLVLLGG